MLRLSFLPAFLAWLFAGAAIASEPSATTPPSSAETEFAAFCERYANDAVAQAKKNQQQKCGLEKANPDRWTLNREDHFNWCIGWEGAYAEPTIEGSHRIVGLKQCAEQQGKILLPPMKIDVFKDKTPSGGQTATVIADVDVYDAPGGGGQLRGVLRAATPGTPPVTVALLAPCQQDNWCHVKGDPVPTGEGWVYSGTPPDFQSLKF